MNSSLTNVAGISIPNLDVNGFQASARRPAVDYNFRLDRIDAARRLIRSCLEESSETTINIHSNVVKAALEQKLGYFLSAGELIVAMVSEDYRYKEAGVDCFFNVDKCSLKNLTRR